MYRAGFNGNDVIVNAIRRGNRNIRFAFFLPLSLSLLAKAKRNVVISVEREREKRGWMDDGATPGVRSNEFTFHPLRIG